MDPPNRLARRQMSVQYSPLQSNMALLDPFHVETHGGYRAKLAVSVQLYRMVPVSDLG